MNPVANNGVGRRREGERERREKEEVMVGRKKRRGGGIWSPEKAGGGRGGWIMAQADPDLLWKKGRRNRRKRERDGWLLLD